MKYGLGYLVKVSNKWYKYDPDLLGNAAIIVDLSTKESKLVNTNTQALSLSEKDVKILVKAAF